MTKFWRGMLLGMLIAWMSVVLPYLLLRTDLLMTGLDSRTSTAFNYTPVGTAKELFQKMRILCFIMSMSKNHRKAEAVAHTWGRRCHKLVFFISVNDTIPKRTANIYVQVDFFPGGERGHMANFPKLPSALLYIHKHFIQDYDWFFKADEDTYAVMENMRYFLADRNPNEPGYFGNHFNYSERTRQGFNSGGAGYILSKEAVRRFATQCHAHPKQCMTSGVEDVEISICFQELGVEPTQDTRDSFGRTRFHAWKFRDHITGAYNDWFKAHAPVDSKIKGPIGISDYAITFHYITPAEMRELEFYVYHLRPYGVTNRDEDINKPPPARKQIIDFSNLEKNDQIL